MPGSKGYTEQNFRCLKQRANVRSGEPQRRLGLNVKMESFRVYYFLL